MKSAHKAQITIAAIGLVGVLGGALFANWDKIFPNEPPDILRSEPEPKPSEESPHENIVTERYKMSVYYFPNREADAKIIAKVLEQEGYIVNTLKEGDFKIKHRKKSYIFYKSSDFEEMTKLRGILSELLDEEFAVYTASADRPDKVLRIVLVARSAI